MSNRSTAPTLRQKFEDTMKPNILKPATPPTFAERLGRRLAWAWQAAARLDRQTRAALVARGMNAALAGGLVWAVRIALLALVLYGVFWVAVLLITVFAAVQSVRRSAEIFPLEKGQWRDDSEGYGYYENGVRTDFGPLFEND
jgi:hypothetical protein